MPAGDPAGYLPNVKKRRKLGTAKQIGAGLPTKKVGTAKQVSAGLGGSKGGTRRVHKPVQVTPGTVAGRRSYRTRKTRSA